MERRGRVFTRPRLFFCAVAFAGMASAADIEWCEQQWISQEILPSSYDGLDPADNVRRWLAVAPRCEGTVFYEARLAFTHIGAGEYARAREILAKLDARDSRYAYLVDLVKIDADSAELAEQAEPRSEDLIAIDERYHKHVMTMYSEQTIEDSVDALLSYGSFMGAIGEHEHAVSLLELAQRARKPARGKLALYRNLAVDYAALGRFEDARYAAQKALDLSPIVMTSPYFVYALAKTQANFGEHAEAVASMEKLAELRPDIVKSETFIAADAFIRQQAKAAQAR
jgi:tetratricopeptide (TPR) repeat protein